MKNQDYKFLIKVTSVGVTGMLPGVFKPQWISKESPSFGFASLFFIFSEIEDPGPRNLENNQKLDKKPPKSSKILEISINCSFFH